MLLLLLLLSNFCFTSVLFQSYSTLNHSPKEKFWGLGTGSLSGVLSVTKLYQNTNRINDTAKEHKAVLDTIWPEIELF